MILVDHFRILLLVGLICVSGIAPAHGDDLKCAKDDAEEVCPADPPPVCAVDVKTGKPAGCTGKEEICKGSELGDALDCKDDPAATHCCCKAAADACNIKSKACENPKLKPSEFCTPTGGGNTAPPPSSPESSDAPADSGTTIASSLGTMILLVSVGASLRRGTVCL